MFLVYCVGFCEISTMNLNFDLSSTKEARENVECVMMCRVISFFHRERQETMSRLLQYCCTELNVKNCPAWIRFNGFFSMVLSSSRRFVVRIIKSIDSAWTIQGAAIYREAQSEWLLGDRKLDRNTYHIVGAPRVVRSVPGAFDTYSGRFRGKHFSTVRPPGKFGKEGPGRWGAPSFFFLKEHPAAYRGVRIALDPSNDHTHDMLPITRTTCCRSPESKSDMPHFILSNPVWFNVRRCVWSPPICSKNHCAVCGDAR